MVKEKEIYIVDKKKKNILYMIYYKYKYINISNVLASFTSCKY